MRILNVQNNKKKKTMQAKKKCIINITHNRTVSDIKRSQKKKREN